MNSESSTATTMAKEFDLEGMASELYDAGYRVTLLLQRENCDDYDVQIPDNGSVIISNAFDGASGLETMGHGLGLYMLHGGELPDPFRVEIDPSDAVDLLLQIATLCLA